MYKHPIVQRIAMVFIHGCKTAEAQEILQDISNICDQNNALVDEFNRLNNMSAQELLDKVKELRVDEVAKLLADGKDPPPMLRSELPMIVPTEPMQIPPLIDVETGLPVEFALQTLRVNLERFYPEVLPTLKGNIAQDIIENADWTHKLNVGLNVPPIVTKPVQVFDKNNKEVEPTPVVTGNGYGDTNSPRLDGDS